VEVDLCVFLQGCYALTSLGRGIKGLRDLYLWDCRSLHDLPADLTVNSVHINERSPLARFGEQTLRARVPGVRQWDLPRHRDWA
jgi:hypothetical protein